MQSRHYELIASVFRYTKPDNTHETTNTYRQWEFMVKEMARSLSVTNVRFNEDKFISACKGE